MNYLPLKKFSLLLLLFVLISGTGNSQIFHRDPERRLFGKTHINKKQTKVKESRYVLKAKKKQEANDRRLKKENEKSVKASQKRSIEIQSPEVQSRMKQNKKDNSYRDRTRKKKLKAGTRSAGKKYD